MDYLEHKGYKGTVEYSKEDDCLFGSVVGLGRTTAITYEGATLSDLREDFAAAVDGNLADCAARGVKPARPYSGHISLRITPALHDSVATAAAAQGTSVNEYIARALALSLEFARV